MLFARWRDERDTAIKALAAVPGDRPVPWPVRPLPPAAPARAGFMDLFAHGPDVADALVAGGAEADHRPDIAQAHRGPARPILNRFDKGMWGTATMVIVMAPDAAAADVDAVVALVESTGGEAFVSRGVTGAGGREQARGSRVVIGLVGDVDRLEALNLQEMRGVAKVKRISTQHKLVSREHHPERSVVHVGGVPIGPDTVTLMAGPCAVETPTQTLAAARMAKVAGAALLRGGAFKPRTSPYAFQGLGERGLRILSDVRDEVGLPIVTEVVAVQDVAMVASYVDMLQIGTRNMQNFSLLQAVGEAGKPVLLKRGMNATIEEWLMAAEYIAQRGNLDIVLCERGIRTFETATRNTLDISAVPVVQRLSHLPVIIDPSHSGGRRDLVLPLSRAGVVAGADGLIVDVHPHPELALCDGPQALTADDLQELSRSVAELTAVMGRRLAIPAQHERRLAG